MEFARKIPVLAVCCQRQRKIFTEFLRLESVSYAFTALGQ
jgi:hypothetical protein